MDDELSSEVLDIFSLVNSRDIREYLRKIEYNFTSLEAAWLIYRCQNLFYEQKKKAWTELIKTKPDCEVPKRMNCAGWKSLHEMLQQYMNVVDKEVSDFYGTNSAEKYVYSYSYSCKDDVEWSEEHETVYASLKECEDAYKEHAADLNQTDSLDGDTGVKKYRIKRQSLVDTKSVLELEYTGSGQFQKIVCNHSRSDDAYQIMNQSFEGLWFNFPTPFVKGDIVCVPSSNREIRFVLDGLSTWEPSDFMVRKGDSSDMNGYGYFVNSDGTVYREVMCNYMDLEYYHGPYKRNEKILPALSKFVKGEIGIEHLLYAYRKVILDVAADDNMLKHWFPHSLLEEIGLD